jgi:hypothetical protein
MKRFVTLLFCVIGMLCSWPGIAGALDSLKGSAEKLIDQQIHQPPPQLAIKAEKVSSVGVGDSGKCKKIPYKWSQGCKLLKQLRSEEYFKVPYNLVSDDLLLEHIKKNSPAIIAELAKIDYGKDLQRYLNGQQSTLPNEAVFLHALELLVDIPKPLEYLNHLIEISIEINNVLASSVLSQSFETLNIIIVGIQVYRNAVGIFTRKREMLETYIWDRCGGTTSGVCKEGNSKDSVWLGIKETYSTYVEKISEDTHIPIKPVDQLGNWFENAFSAYRLVAYDDSNSIRYVEGEAIARSAKPQGSKGKDDIRKIDFLNYSYNPAFCTQEFGNIGLGKVVRVVNGQFENPEVSYSVGPIAYGDLTNDNNLEAIVHNECWLSGANYGLSQIFVYTMKNGQPSLLAQLNNDDFNRDYVRYYPGGILWFTGGVTVVGGNLAISVPAEGAHCCPIYVATLKYRWNGTTFVLDGKAERRKFTK